MVNKKFVKKEADTLTTLTKRIAKPVVKDKGLNQPYFYNPTKNAVHQADTLSLPNDKGFIYALVVIDIATKKVDFTFMRNKDANTVKNAFIKIYTKNNILKFPTRIETDPGTEFKNETVQQFFKDKSIKMRFGKTGRHRQQGMVERANQTIGSMILLDQLKREIQTKKVKRTWIHLRKQILDEVNNKAKPTKEKYISPTCEGSSCEILQQGTKVLAPLDEPRDIEGKKLHGRFRSADQRYNIHIRSVKEVILKPNSPPLYLLDGQFGDLKIEPVAYTKNQLLVLSDAEIDILKKI
jgi:transposase InsO family protein